MGIITLIELSVKTPQGMYKTYIDRQIKLTSAFAGRDIFGRYIDKPRAYELIQRCCYETSCIKCLFQEHTWSFSRLLSKDEFLEELTFYTAHNPPSYEILQGVIVLNRNYNSGLVYTVDSLEEAQGKMMNYRHKVPELEKILCLP